MAELNTNTDTLIIDKPIPVEPDFPIGGPTPEATIKVEGDTRKAPLSLDSRLILPVRNRIEGTDGPDILFSTPQDDLILAKGGDDVILGSLGNDIINGGAGFDTLDYTRLGRKITLLPQGLIGNGDSQGSQIQEIEKIVGAPKKGNTIDGSGGKGPVFFTINLADELLVVEDIPRLGSVKFVVENFVNVNGTQNSDSIAGDRGKNKLSGKGGNDNLIGNFGNDTLIGGSGNDTLTGADPSIKDTVKREKDILTGGKGVDNFVLGNKSGSFYDDFGDKDFARITDFSAGEQINLGDGEIYNLELTKQGFNIFLIEDFARDLIGKVKFSSGSGNRKIRNDSRMLSDSPTLMEPSSDALVGDVLEGDFTTIKFGDEGIVLA